MENANELELLIANIGAIDLTFQVDFLQLKPAFLPSPDGLDELSATSRRPTHSRVGTAASYGLASVLGGEEKEREELDEDLVMPPKLSEEDQLALRQKDQSQAVNPLLTALAAVAPAQPALTDQDMEELYRSHEDKLETFDASEIGLTCSPSSGVPIPMPQTYITIHTHTSLSLSFSLSFQNLHRLVVDIIQH